MRGGLHLGPPGKWWDDKALSQELGLTHDQQKHMDSIFNDNRAALVAHLQALHEEESRMDVLARSPSIDEATAFAEIDRIAEAHAALEKTNAHMLLSIRHEMTPDQITRLEAYLDAHRPPPPPLQ